MMMMMMIMMMMMMMMMMMVIDDDDDDDDDLPSFYGLSVGAYRNIHFQRLASSLRDRKVNAPFLVHDQWCLDICTLSFLWD